MSNTHTAFQSPSRPGSRIVVMHRGRAVAPALLVLLAAGGCSEGGESAETSEGPVAATESDSVPATDIAGRPLVTTTAVPAGPSSLPVSAPVVSATAVPSSTATNVGSRDAAADVGAAVGVAERAFLVAMRDPESDDGLSMIEAVTAPGSEAQAELAGIYNSRRSAGLAFRENTRVPFSIVIEGDVEVLTPTTATVVVCVVDSDEVMRREVHPDGGSEELAAVESDITAARFVEDFIAIDGAWLLARREQITYYPGATTCPPG